MNNNEWQTFNEQAIWIDNYQDVEGLIWRKENGVWIMLVGVPSETGRVMTIQVNYNPFTGEKLT